MRAGDTARRPRPSACAAARDNRGQPRLLYYRYFYDHYYACYCYSHLLRYVCYCYYCYYHHHHHHHSPHYYYRYYHYRYYYHCYYHYHHNHHHLFLSPLSSSLFHSL